MYPVRLTFRPAVAWPFEPGIGCCLRRQGLSGDGWCALAATPGEARELLVKTEVAYG